MCSWSWLCALLAAGIAILAAVWSGDNKVALWVFAVLWVMRLLAKLNLHFGVPNLGDELLPPRLRYLGTYFSRGPATPLLPARCRRPTSLMARLRGS